MKIITYLILVLSSTRDIPLKFIGVPLFYPSLSFLDPPPSTELDLFVPTAPYDSYPQDKIWFSVANPPLPPILFELTVAPVKQLAELNIFINNEYIHKPPNLLVFMISNAWKPMQQFSLLPIINLPPAATK